MSIVQGAPFGNGWRRGVLGILLLGLSASAVFASRHPGHGSKVVLGVLREVTREAIVVEVRDVGPGGATRVRVLLTEDTRYRIDKERLTSLDTMIGQRAIVSVDWEDDDRGGQTLTATEVRFTRAKK
jgi:hypothetical protein